MQVLYQKGEKPAAIAEQAVRAAMAYDASCGGRVEMRTVKLARGK